MYVRKKGSLSVGRKKEKERVDWELNGLLIVNSIVNSSVDEGNTNH